MLHEECGVFGIFSPIPDNLAVTVYDGLSALQHRGQEAAGIAVNQDRQISFEKGCGLVSEVFGKDRLKRLPEGKIAVGHVRYATTGETSEINAQPLVIKHVKGQLALCHNGNLVNGASLRKALELEGNIFHTTSDTEVIAYLMTKHRLKTPSIERALIETMAELKGAYSLVMMSPAKLLACRDPLGIRPLCYGVTPEGKTVFASESCALDAIGARFVRDVAPGEVIVVDEKGLRSFRNHCDTKPKALCVFELIYFARSDSIIEKVSIQAARKQAGRYLAKAHPADADLVIGVPDSGLDAAMGFAEASGIPYGTGLIKNKYIGRTFIEGGQRRREKLLRLKLGIVKSAVAGKRVVMIDDSIVRGTTMRRIVALVRDAGASAVHVRVSAPPFLNPCYYGTDVPSRDKLIACGHRIDEIRAHIGADSLGFLSVDEVLRLSPEKEPSEFCAACFDGRYAAGVPADFSEIRS